MECQAHPVMGRACTLAALAFALILLSACGGSSSSPPPPPSGSLSYPSATQTFTVGTAVTPITPTITGTLSGFTVSPALPAGLSLDAAKGTISGTPTVLAPAATYTVSAMVSGGTTTSGSVSIAVEDIAPSQVSYGASSFSFSATVPITELTPTTAGGPVVSWSISPALPAGLNFNTTDGSISGTPSAVSASARYVVTAQNSGGQSTVSLTITVDDIAPSQVSYGASSFSFSATVPSTKLTPTSAGGSVVSWSISPALPAGLNFNTTDGSISGTPSAVSASARYVVTAQTSGGHSTVSLTITVDDIAPSQVSYGASSFSFSATVPSTKLTPTSAGGSVVSWSISPALPAGLNFNTTDGSISGTPSAVSASARYVVTAQTSGGHSTVSLTITVDDIAPSQVSYGASSFSFSATVPSTKLTPTSAGGSVVSWSISPALPAGLNFNTTDGSISGTPSAVSASASYVVTAQNSGGQSTVSLTIAVNAGPLLTLGHQSGIAATRATATRVLSVEFGLPQHWILWDYAAASVIATGTAGCGPTGSCPQNLIDMAGSTAVIVGPTGFEIRAASDGQVLGNISKPFVVNWMLATDGSYIATWGGTDLSAWSTSGQLLFSKSGNYGGASVFAAPNELRVA